MRVMDVPIPLYRIKAILRHYRTLAARGSFDRRDTRAANALRISAAEIAWLERTIENHRRNGKRKPIQ